MAASESRTPRYFLILPAAGSGRRMQVEAPKQYLGVAGKSLLQHSLEGLGAWPEIMRVAIALSADDTHWSRVAARLAPALAAKIATVAGGVERLHSVSNALNALRPLAADEDWVLVHDAVRPCVHPADVRKLMTELSDEEAGGLLASQVRETLKEDDEAGHVRRTVDRSRIWQAATPQMFRFAVLQRALERAIDTNMTATDEAAAVEALGLPVKLVAGRADNLKVTYPGDLLLAEAILQAQSRETN